jgi:hypothetical protein
MEYRGIEYAVVQTIENDWRWSVKRAPKDKVGKSSHRDTAIVRAHQFATMKNPGQVDLTGAKSFRAYSDACIQIECSAGVNCQGEKEGLAAK